MKPFECQQWNTKSCWHPVDIHLNNMLTVIVWRLSGHKPRPRTELDEFLTDGQQPRQSERPTSAASTSAPDSRARRGPRHLIRWRPWSHWLPDTTDWSAGIHLLESTYNGSATERTINANGVQEEQPRCRSTSSAIVGGGKTSSKPSGKLRERCWARKQADADMCRSQSCYPWNSAIKGLWTASQQLTSGSSCPNDWKYGAGTEADTGAGSSGSGFISFRFFTVFVQLITFICQQG